MSAPNETPARSVAPLEDPSAVPLPSSVAAIVILAAGGGTRMKSTRSKLLHEVAGHSLLSYAVNAATALQPDQLVVVVGAQREDRKSVV